MDRTSHGARSGPLSLFTLVAMVCLAVLAVLAVSTARASASLSARQAQATTEQYQAEAVAQAFVADVNDALASGGDLGDTLAAIATAASTTDVTCNAEYNEPQVQATFTTSGGRVLSLVLTVRPGEAARVDRWTLGATRQSDDTGDTLWTGAP